ncbi:MAG: PD-(D/E)XK nuclease family protein [Mucilaginibacter sp.]
MEIHQYNTLLNGVNSIQKKYKKISELSGENFNVFRILKVESLEVKTHSAFIAELLNPKGSHGQSDTFLKLFVSAFCFKKNSIDTQSCRVKVEDSVGLIDQELVEGGRIDITITDKYYNQILIENKIDARDQNQQLKRYFNYSKNADLIYLTLDGREPGEHSKEELEADVHFKCYSYEKDILNWLELCRKEAAIYPIIREAITHYINLIKYLTNQTQNQNMQEELSDLLKSNLEASFAIRDNLNMARDKISEEFGKTITTACNTLRLDCDYKIRLDKNYSGIWISKPKWQFFNIGFQFQSYSKDLIYGILTKENPVSHPVDRLLKEQLKALPNNTAKNNIWWGWYNRLQEPFDNWDKYEAWQAILDGRMKDNIMEKVSLLLKLTKDIKM